MEADKNQIGNFTIGEIWCDVSCKHGHQIRIINIYRSHYAICDECKTYLWLGCNLSSSWNYENEEIWEANRKIIQEYSFPV